MNKSKIDSLDIFGKLRIYFHYCDVQFSIKHSFQVVEKTIENQLSHNNQKIHWRMGRGEPDKEFGNIALYYLWKNHNPISFEDFQKERIYDWYWRFEDELSHI
jgi:hypothetical protein